MSDEAVYALAALFVVFASVNLWVTKRLIAAAVVRPHIDSLTATSVVSTAITVASVIGAVLGLNGIAAIKGTPFIPQPWGFVLLLVALAGPSAANVYMLRAIRRWDGHAKAPPPVLHMRGGDQEPTPHRRAEDSEGERPQV